MIYTNRKYRHHKGGTYFVLMVCETHNHNGDQDVVYISLAYGKGCTRPLKQDSRKGDAWTDEVKWPDDHIRCRFITEDAFQSLDNDMKTTLHNLWFEAGAAQAEPPR